jgi:hypothetical protein
MSTSDTRTLSHAAIFAMAIMGSVVCLAAVAFAQRHVQAASFVLDKNMVDADRIQVLEHLHRGW